MRSPIGPAIEFGHAFYESLADGLSVDAAVAEARKAVSMALPDTMEWGTPVLYLRASDGRIFDIPRGAPPPPGRKKRPVDESKRVPASDIPPKGIPAPEMPPPSESESEPGEASKPGTSQRLQEWYTEALSSYYTKQWSKAIELLAKIVDVQRDFRDARNKLEAARRQLQLFEFYLVAEGTVQTEAWDDAIAALEGILALDETYRDAATRLQAARQRKELAELVAEARQLHQAGAWEAVIAIFEHIRSIDNVYPDPGDCCPQPRTRCAGNSGNSNWRSFTDKAWNTWIPATRLRRSVHLRRSSVSSRATATRCC